MFEMFSYSPCGGLRDLHMYICWCAREGCHIPQFHRAHEDTSSGGEVFVTNHIPNFVQN